jgi:hypothetical protein
VVIKTPAVLAAAATLVRMLRDNGTRNIEPIGIAASVLRMLALLSFGPLRRGGIGTPSSTVYVLICSLSFVHPSAWARLLVCGYG